MNGINLLADTNFLIYLLRGEEFVKKYKDNTLGISIISEIELLGWYGITDSKRKIIESFLNELTIFPINEKIKHNCIHLKQKYRIKTPDALIAATAIWLKVPIITADKSFRNIKEASSIIIEI